MLISKNKRAYHDFEILETYTAGLKLLGHETKALREKKASFEGAHVKIMQGIPYVVGLHIGTYSKKSTITDPTETTRRRELLLTKREIQKIEQKLAQKGHTAIPLALILRNNLIKLEVGVVKGRKEFEKKVVAKERQIKKDLETFNKSIRQTEGMTRI